MGVFIVSFALGVTGKSRVP